MKTVMSLLLIPLISFGGTHRLTGNPRIDLLAATPGDTLPQSQTIMAQSQAENPNHKTPLLAGVMSIIVPGSGEYYSQRYVKSGVFFALEVASLTAAIVYTNKGNSKTTEFQNYADAHWSAADYANWILKNGANYEIAGNTYPTITVNNANASLPPWQRVDFSQINAWEAAPHTIGFSHELPAYGTQQYYELIGKYSQFKYGWDTYQYNGDHTGDDGYNVDFIPQQMKDYADNRGKANDYYYAAGLATAVVVTNHILSAIDGIWSTSNYNKQVTSEMGLRFQDLGGGEVALTTELTVKVQL